MRTAMQIKKKTSQHTVRGAARCKVALFLHTTLNPRAGGYSDLVPTGVCR